RMLDLLGGRSIPRIELPPTGGDGYLNLLSLHRQKRLLPPPAPALFAAFPAASHRADLPPFLPYPAAAIRAEPRRDSLPPAPSPPPTIPRRRPRTLPRSVPTHRAQAHQFANPTGNLRADHASDLRCARARTDAYSSLPNRQEAQADSAHSKSANQVLGTLGEP